MNKLSTHIATYDLLARRNGSSIVRLNIIRMKELVV